MNKTHRIVWSESRQTYIVAHEKAATRGKPSSSRRALAQAITAALLALGAGQALADSCLTAGANNITISVSDTCVLGTGESLTVDGTDTNTGEILFSVSSSGTGTGINVNAVAGSIVNSGTISGTNSGEDGVGVGILVTGSLTGINNSGQIKGYESNNGAGNSGVTNGIGIMLSGGRIDGAIINSGTIRGVTDAEWQDGETTAIGAAIFLKNSTITGSITNSGLLYGSGTTATGIRMRNNSLILGAINNSGVITGNGGDGIDIYGSTIADGIDNSGLIEDGIRNGGTITSAAAPGIYIHDGGSISGNIYSNGTISGVSGIMVSGGKLSGTIDNGGTGTISGNESGIKLISNSTVDNIYNGTEGAIRGNAQSDEDKASNGGIFLNNSTISGSITNNGLIDGAEGGIFLNGSARIVQGIINSGTITGTSYGIDTFGSDNIISGGLINSGAIAGGSIGIKIYGNNSISGGITNSGTIQGSQYALAVYGALDSLNLAGDHARLLGNVSAPNTDVTITGGATFSNDNAFDVKTFTVAEGATFNMGPGPSTQSCGYKLPEITIGIAPSGDVGKARHGKAGNRFACNYIEPEITGVSAPLDGDARKAVARQGHARNRFASMPESGIAASGGANNYGTLSVASSVSGTITGDLDTRTDALFKFEVTDNTHYGKLGVTGTAYLVEGTKFEAFGDCSSLSGTIAGVISYGATDWPLDSTTVTGTGSCADYTLTAVKNTANKTVDLVIGSSSPLPTATGVSALAGDGSATVSFTAGGSISGYTAYCEPTGEINPEYRAPIIESGAADLGRRPRGNHFSSLPWPHASGSSSPITVPGMTNGVQYQCKVMATDISEGGTSDWSNEVTPHAATSTPVTYYTPPPSSITDLHTGGDNAAPPTGATINVIDNGKEGTGIDLPPPPTTPPTGTPGTPGSSGTPSPTGINIILPGTGTVNVSSDSSGTKLGVQGVTMPGETKEVSTVMVTQGSASFTATKEGQPVASLKNGIFVVSGDAHSHVTVDATGHDTKIGVTSSDTIVVPTGSTGVSGTSVDLPPPTASGGAASTISVKIGDQNLSVQSSQSDTKMTFKVVDIGGVQTPVLEVTGSAVVSGNGDNQPIVSIAGNVIKTGKSGGSSQVCNTIVQASSNTSSDVVHVVTCYIVLEPGSFSAMSGGNGFAAIKDGIVWAGETAEFDKNGKVTAAYLGTRPGNTDAVGDDMVPGGAKFAAGGYNVDAFIPRLSGTPLRLNGAKLDERIFAVVSHALGVAVQPALPLQSDQGVLNFTFNGNLTGQGVQNTQVNYTINTDTASVMPSKRIYVDTSRADGVSISAEGDVSVATGGLVTTFTPSVADPKAFAEKINQLLPGSTVILRWNGSWQVTAADGSAYVGRPQWSFWPAEPGAATFSTTPDGNLLYSDNGRAQPIFPDFYDYDTLQATFRTELKDPALTVLPRMDGTATATVNGKTYTLAPQWNLTKPAAGKPAWWIENGVVYIKNADGSAQGFMVK